MKARGFTLLELMTTVAVLGLMLSLSVAGYVAMAQKGKESAAVREIYMLALQARKEARSRNQPVRFSVREVTQNGARYQAVRWERLPCGDMQFGENCPTSTCETKHFAEGCTEATVGPDVLVPVGLTMTNLSGLCFLGGSGAPRGMTCSDDPAALALESVKFEHAGSGALSHLVLEPLTGTPRLLDCKAQGADADPKKSSLCP